MMVKRLAVMLKGRNADQRGIALIIALILLALGGLMIAPLLAFMGSGHFNTHEVYDVKAKQLYAADAGVRYAIAQIKNGAGDTVWTDIPDTLGDQRVRYRIDTLPEPNPYGSPAYRITSEGGIDPDTNNNKTVITADIMLVDFFKVFTENAITSPAYIDGGSTGNQTLALGDVMAPDSSYVQTTSSFTTLTQDAPANSTTLYVENTSFFGAPPFNINVIYMDGGLAKTDKNLTCQSITDVHTMTIGAKNHKLYPSGSIVYVPSSSIAPTPETPGGWPPDLTDGNPVRNFYYDQVKNLTENKISYNAADHEIILSTSDPNGPACFDDGNPNQNYTLSGTGKLSGVIYVNGNLTIDANLTLGREVLPSTGLSLADDVSSASTSIQVNPPVLDPFYEAANPYGLFPKAGRVIVGTATSAEVLEYKSIDYSSGTLELDLVKTGHPPGSHSKGEPVTLWLGQTIFTTGTITVNSGPHNLVGGPGALVALGDISYDPNVPNNEKYVYLMSVNGNVNFQPSNLVTFYGSIAGKNMVDPQPNLVIIWQDYKARGYNLNLPGASGYAKVPAGIQTWIIK